MAAKLLDEIDEHYLTCQICLERFINARVLPCQHSFCEDCLTRLVTRTGVKIHCPSCRSEFDLQDGVKCLPRNLQLNALTDLLQQRDIADRSTGQFLCEGCENRPSINHCIQCAIKICDNCAKTHQRVRLTSGHTLIDLGPPCSKHNEHPLDRYCTKCSKQICNMCVEIEHQKHECLPIQDAWHKKVADTSDTYKSLHKKQQEVQTVTNNIHSALVTLKDLYDAENTRLESHSKRVINRLRETMKQIEQNIHEDTVTKSRYLQTEYESRQGYFHGILSAKTSLKEKIDVAMSSLKTVTENGGGREVFKMDKLDTEKLLSVEDNLIEVVKFPKLFYTDDMNKMLMSDNFKHMSIGNYRTRAVKVGYRPQQRKVSKIVETHIHVEEVQEVETSQVASLKLQNVIIRDILKTPLRKGDRRYMLSTHWFKLWNQYVAHGQDDDQSQLAQHPGPVDNATLFVNPGENVLKSNLADKIDYILIPYEAWDKLVLWYNAVDGQVPLARTVSHVGVTGTRLCAEDM
uniref:E3 ubiquitin-protein ligase TRIM56-like n=1 Tax=Saccoglossus kowalevskii TaxID=10224 RepID=A0ABM0MPL3_SACKO|nr:PREDICTED: E3 ubiquitin-protein ligase TRIM56-like [Saccoglossus kowalevskii]